MLLGQRVRNLSVVTIEDLFFFFKNTMILSQKLVFVLESQTIFCPIHKVLQANCMTGFCIPTA